MCESPEYERWFLRSTLNLLPSHIHTHTHTHTHTAACVSFRCYDIEIAKLTDTCDYNVHYYARVKLNIPKFVGTVRIDEASFEPVIDGISLGFSSVRPRITYMDQESGTNRTSTEIQSGPSVLEIESKLQVKRQSWINVWLTRHPKRVVTSTFTMYRRSSDAPNPLVFSHLHPSFRILPLAPLFPPSPSRFRCTHRSRPHGRWGGVHRPL